MIFDNKPSAMPAIDEFPREVAELLNLMSKLGISPSLMENVLEEAVGTELLYKFGSQPISEMLKFQLKTQVLVWCDIISALTGREINLEDFELK